MVEKLQEERILTKRELQEAIAREVGVFLIKNDCPVQYSGYPYLKESIVQAMLGLRGDSLVNRIIYMDIAKKYNTSVQNVEKCIRTIIDKWWRETKQQYLHTMFTARPTSKHLIAKCAECISLNLHKT